MHLNASKRVIAVDWHRKGGARPETLAMSLGEIHISTVTDVIAIGSCEHASASGKESHHGEERHEMNKFTWTRHAGEVIIRERSRV
jgi:hypothetical protein